MLKLMPVITRVVSIFHSTQEQLGDKSIYILFPLFISPKPMDHFKCHRRKMCVIHQSTEGSVNLMLGDNSLIPFFHFLDQL